MTRFVRALAATGAALALLAATASPAGAVGVLDPGADGDDAVTGQAFVRHDGGTDQAIQHCNDQGTSTDPDADPNDGDSDSNDGGSRRQGNEPFTVIDPTDPDTVVAGWNDYCQTDLGAGWQGFGYSRDGGETWINSFVPGYPADTSAEGMASPLFGRHTEAGDPIAAFDNAGNLFVGGISFNRGGPINGDVYVATYSAADVPIAGAPAYPVDYSHTRVVGQGTPSRNFVGIFQDKPLLEVDRTGGETDGNVYVCWSRFTGFGQNKIQFSRSTDGGQTFSKPVFLTAHGQSGSVQSCDIAIEGDGDVYVTFRTFADASQNGENALYFTRSTNGGASFGGPVKIRGIVPYAPADPFRDCGDGPFECTSQFVFARVPLEPRSTADQSGGDGVHLVYNEIDPASVEPTTSTYRSAGGGMVGRSVVYVVSSTDDGATWSEPVKVDDAGGLGHQFFPDIDALAGTLAVVWQDSRTDQCYSVQLPMGNTPNATSCGSEIVNTFVASSLDGGATWSPSAKVSDVGHQPQYEMFGNRDIPFQGDYNWVSIVQADNGLEAYVSWTDNRDVVQGEDPREEVQDGFDVHQCRQALEGGGFGPDQCANAGGVDQNIYGNRVSLP
ncbi:MAG: sialidase family protein [Candidatus Limnocylindria bacterium]